MRQIFFSAKAFLSSKVLLTFMVIIGTVIGSGFMSGKEIVVFFTRFGKISFLCIFLAFLLFFGLFYFFLSYGNGAIERLKKSKLSFAMNTAICFILSTAMFAGVSSSIKNLPIVVRIAIMLLVIIYSARVALKGATLLEKINLILVPIMIIFLLANLGYMFSLNSGLHFEGAMQPYSVFYCLLYVILNTSNSAIVITSVSQDLTKRQKVQVSFFAALALSLLILFANIVLLQNPQVYGEDMPLLALFEGWQKTLMSVIILLGCITTLFSLVFTTSCSLRGVYDNKFFVLLVSVVLPLCVSTAGFGYIVSILYPLTSVLGMALLADLFFCPFFKKVYKKIHASSKHTQHSD